MSSLLNFVREGIEMTDAEKRRQAEAEFFELCESLRRAHGLPSERYEEKYGHRDETEVRTPVYTRPNYDQQLINEAYREQVEMEKAVRMLNIGL